MSVLLKIDPRAQVPVFRQIMDQIIRLVDSESLRPGDRLPATRDMARRLSVSRATVYRAYQELWSLGYLESRPGAYSTVRRRPKVLATGLGSDPGVIPWERRSSAVSEALYQAHRAEEALLNPAVRADLINFVPLSPDSRLFPTDAFRRAMNHVLARHGAELLQYGSPLGYHPLRAYIAERMRLHGVWTTPDQIMITTGAQNAIERLLRLLAPPGARVAFESPTYSRAMDIFRLAQVEMTGVPMTPRGMDLEALDAMAAQDPPALVYTIPNFHNPTGITTDQGHRERLLAICESYRIPLVEDGFEEEMKYFGKAVLPIKSMDQRGVVVYLGTFSKILFPGLRIGWIAADPGCIERLAPIQKALILSGNLLDQAALYRFCRLGEYDLHVNRMHRIYRRRMQTALKALKATFGSDRRIRWTEPCGGYTIWLRLEGLSQSEPEVLGVLRRHGVMLLPGSFHFHGAAQGVYFRLSIAHLDEATITEGIRRLALGLDALRPSRNPGRSRS
jgi:GntR family transcriptional regulator/MocR family aminotransferase